MIKRPVLVLILLFIFSAPVSTFAAMNVSVSEHYTTGEPAVIMIESDTELNPEELTIQISKPNGTKAELSVRQEGWNTPTQCFNTFTVDQDGTFSILVTNSVTQDMAAAEFTSSMFSSGSMTLYLFSIMVMLVCMGYWYIKIYKPQKEGKL